MRLPRFLVDAGSADPTRGFVIGLDMEGNVIHNLQDPSSAYASHVTGAREYEGVLYMGSTDAIAILSLPAP